MPFFSHHVIACLNKQKQLTRAVSLQQSAVHNGAKSERGLIFYMNKRVDDKFLNTLHILEIKPCGLGSRI